MSTKYSIPVFYIPYFQDSLSCNAKSNKGAKISPKQGLRDSIGKKDFLRTIDAFFSKINYFAQGIQDLLGLPLGQKQHCRMLCVMFLRAVITFQNNRISEVLLNTKGFIR